MKRPSEGVPGRPQQLGKFSQPIETKWAVLHQLGKKPHEIKAALRTHAPQQTDDVQELR
jgi:hypothetical protein